VVTSKQVGVDGARHTVWDGGDGDVLLLVHGGWGGAAMHWATVWEELAKRFRVIAPELPGIDEWTAPGLRSFSEYARLLERLLDALAVPCAWVLGNSFGAAVSWQLASRAT
jgi:2-hydroxy-6-oxonona-2,4-dienedioate hydrolase